MPPRPPHDRQSTRPERATAPARRRRPRTRSPGVRHTMGRRHTDATPGAIMPRDAPERDADRRRNRGEIDPDPRRSPPPPRAPTRRACRTDPRRTRSIGTRAAAPSPPRAAAGIDAINPTDTAPPNDAGVETGARRPSGPVARRCGRACAVDEEAAGATRQPPCTRTPPNGRRSRIRAANGHRLGDHRAPRHAAPRRRTDGCGAIRGTTDAAESDRRRIAR